MDFYIVWEKESRILQSVFDGLLIKRYLGIHIIKKEFMVKTMKKPEFGRGGELSTIIGKGTVIKGNIKVQNSLRVDGKIIGNVTTSDSLIVGRDGSVEGNIEAKNVLLAGKVKGNILSTEKVFMESKASIYGDIQASRLVVDEGAHFEGNCSMKDSVQKSQDVEKETGDK